MALDHVLPMLHVAPKFSEDYIRERASAGAVSVTQQQRLIEPCFLYLYYFKGLSAHTGADKRTHAYPLGTV